MCPSCESGFELMIVLLLRDCGGNHCHCIKGIDIVIGGAYCVSVVVCCTACYSMASAAADIVPGTLPLGEVRQVGKYCFAWRVQGILSSEEDYVLSPAFTANGFAFNILHSTELRPEGRSMGTCINLYLQAHAIDAKHWPTAEFYLGLRCVDKSLPDMQDQCSICPALVTCLWKKTEHAFWSEEDDWGFTRMRENLDGLTAQDTMEYWVCFESLDYAPCSLNHSITLFVNQQVLNTSQFWGSSAFSDCTVRTEDGKAFNCHKLTLCAASPVLRAMFTSSAGMSDASSNSIIIREADPAVVELLLKTIYCISEKVPCHSVVALYKLADQYQIAGVKDILLQELQATPLLADATATLLPQSHALGTTAEALTTHIIKQAIDHVENLFQPPSFVQDWQLADVQLLLSRLQPSQAYSALQAASTWACSGASGEQQEQERIQQWPPLQGLLQLQQLKTDQLKRMRQDEVWLKRLERLPWLSVALMFVMIDRIS